MRCVVTGVAGFIGSSLAEALLEGGHEVTGIDCFTDYYARSLKEANLEVARSSSRFIFVEENLLSAEIARHLEGAEVIFHQAAQAGVRASWGKYFSSYTDNNIMATQHLLELARQSPLKESLKRIVYASTSSVYGSAETLPTTEDMTPAPVSPYGVSKLAGEHLMCLYNKEFGVPTVSLRYFTVYGPRQRPDMAFNIFIRAGLKGEEISIYGDGEQSRDFTFITDIVQANIAAATRYTKQLVFNVGGGSRVTVNYVLRELEQILNRKLRIVYKERQRGDARHTGADISRASREIGYAPQVPLLEGLAREARWLEATLCKS